MKIFVDLWCVINDLLNLIEEYQVDLTDEDLQIISLKFHLYSQTEFLFLYNNYTILYVVNYFVMKMINQRIFLDSIIISHSK